MSQIDSLNQQLEDARRAYYAGEPIMSDAEYDALEQELAGLAAASYAANYPKDPVDEFLPSVLTTVGTDAPGRIKHRSPMRSIENKYTYEELVKWVDDIQADNGLDHWPVVTLGSKWDGISASITYERGQIVQALTRGDGEAGESILPQILASPRIPNKLHDAFSIEIRGELVIQRSTMERLNVELAAAGKKPYVSTRNLVAGTMKLQDLAEVTRREVRFIPWEVRQTSVIGYLDHLAARLQLQELADLGFGLPDDVTINNADELIAALNRMVPTLSDVNAEVGRDGLVLKINSWPLREKLGVGSKFANYQTCFKAQNAKTETILKEVVWQVGRQGRLTPVGIVEPVVLAGATIERVTLNNLSWIRDMGLKLGSRVMLMRSGDVIPKIVEVLDGE